MAPHADNSTGSSAAATKKQTFVVNSPNVEYTPTEIKSRYNYKTTLVSEENGQYVATPKETVYDFKVERTVPKTGMMLVGLGGNNGCKHTQSFPAQLFPC